jgi:hypothetical protein
LRVRSCRHHSFWLVQQVVDKVRLDTNRNTIDAHHISIDINATPKLSDLIVHRHATLGDQDLTGPATPPATLRQHLLKAFSLPLAIGYVGIIEIPRDLIDHADLTLSL